MSKTGCLRTAKLLSKDVVETACQSGVVDLLRQRKRKNIEERGLFQTCVRPGRTAKDAEGSQNASKPYNSHHTLQRFRKTHIRRAIHWQLITFHGFSTIRDGTMGDWSPLRLYGMLQKRRAQAKIVFAKIHSFSTRIALFSW